MSVPDERPATSFTQEIRLAVVMYGGISLAIYINGIAQELLKLVRATAPDPVLPGLARHADSQLTGTEVVYRKLGRLLARGEPPAAEPAAEIRSRFVVDLLAGTSAGGINAIYLAKALANDQPIEDLERLWVQEGDIARLINDERAVEGLPIGLDEPPRAPLSGDRMYLKLLEAFAGMDRGPADGAVRSPNVDDLDLFVTATDVRGWRTALRAEDSLADERRYRAVFQLRYRAVDDQPPAVLGMGEDAHEQRPAPPPDRNDFAPANNPFLAFIARCTSAHQAAFQPMRLTDVTRILVAHPYYREQPWALRPELEPWRRLYPRVYLDEQRSDSGNQFASRDFADGGVLDNKPFSYILDSLPTRSGKYPVDRKLLFVDPAPEQFKGGDITAPPDFVENGLAALTTIRGYETIREDLEQLRQHNLRAARVRRLVLAMEQDLCAYGQDDWDQIVAQGLSCAQQRQRSIPDLIKHYGIAWATWQRLRVPAASAFVAHSLARGAGIEDSSPPARKLRAALGAWAQLQYAAAEPTEGPTIVALLQDFDSDWHVRRLRRALDALDELVGFGERGALLVQVAQRYNHALHAPGLPPYPPPEDERPAFRGEVLQLRAALSGCYGRLREGRAALVADGERHPLAEAIRAQGLPGLIEALPLDARLPYDQLEAWLLAAFQRQEHESVCRLKASLDLLILGSDGSPGGPGPSAAALQQDHEVLARLLVEIPSVPGTLRAELLGLLEAEQYELFGLVGLAETDGNLTLAPPSYNDTAASVIRYCTLEFDRYDRVVYPLMAASEAGDELDGVEIYRVSPADAGSLVDELQSGPKLAGTTLGAFGAFFDRRFRVNDIMWGRLDGAERIIAALLPGPEHAALRRQLTEEAQDAILRSSFFKDHMPEPPTLAERRAAFQRIYQEEHASSRALDNEALAESASRISRVVSKMFAVYGEAHPQARPFTLWGNRLLGLGAAVADAALARSLGGIFSRHWLTLIYLFALLQIVLGAIFGSPSIQTFGLVLGGAALGFHMLVLLTRDVLAGRRRWLLIGGALAVAVLAVLLAAAAALSGLWLAGRLGPDAAGGLLAWALRPESILLAAALAVALLTVAGLLVNRQEAQAAKGKPRA